MMFQSAILACMALVATADFVPTLEIPATSKHGLRLMKKATQVDSEGRELEQNNNAQWLTNYSLKYMGCSSLIQIAREGGDEESGALYTENLIKFGLCPVGQSCSSCTGKAAQYVVSMDEFMETYVQMKQEEQESACENVANYCYCNDQYNDDESCQNQCYADAGLDYCIEVEGQEQVEIERYMECAEVEGNNNNNNNNNGNYNYNYNNGNNNNNNVNQYQQYFAGAYCNPKDGHSVNIGVFYDAGCTAIAPSGTYEALTYGMTLPFEKESIISSECISCVQVDEDENDNNNNNNGNNNNGNYNNYYNNNGNNNNNNNNNQNQAELSEICERSYEMAARCEEGLTDAGQYFYPDTTGCQYINNILPQLERATQSITSSSRFNRAGGGGGRASTGFAVIFGLSTIVLGAYSFFLYRKIHRAKVNLSHSEGGNMA